MAAIVDQFGRPLERQTLSEPQTARLASRHREFAGHPSRGLTPQRLASILEAAEQGDIVQQHELFLDMIEKDAHIYAEMAKRHRALLTVPWSVAAPRNATGPEKALAAEVEEWIRDIPQFEDVLLDLMDGVGHGFSNLEIEWGRQGKVWLPASITHRTQSWFQLDRETRMELRLRDDTPDGAPLQPFGWISHIHRAKSGYIARAGLCRILSWPYLFKNYSIRDLAEFLEIYGLPLRVGKYPSGATDTEKSTLLAAVVGIGHNAAGIMPDSMMVEIMEAAKGSEGPFLAMNQWAESSVSKAILGGTLTSQADGKSSTNALGNVHNEVRHDILEADARQVAATLSSTLIHYLVALNKGNVAVRLPHFEIDTSEPEDLVLFSEALPALADAGVQIPVAWVSERLKIPVPKEGEAVMGRVVATAINRATLKAGTDTGAVPIDPLTGRMATEGEDAWKGILDQLRALIDDTIAQGGDLSALRDRLLDAYGDLDTSTLQRVMQSGFAAAALSGRFDVARESGLVQ